jgi:hypothetical protein
MKNNEKGFSVVEGLLIVLVLAVIGFVAVYVLDRNNQQKSTTQPTASNQQSASEVAKDKETPEVLDWERITSGPKTFSVQIPDGWGEILRPLTTDWLTIRGEKQPLFTDGKPVVVRDLEGFGTDGPSVFSIVVHDNIAEPRGTATTFRIGDLEGKKYTRIVQEDSEPALDQEFKGDKKYDYRFKLANGKQLVVWYNVYARADTNDQIATVDKIVTSIKL